MMMSFKQTLSVATIFWGACLVLVALESTLGSNAILGTLFFLSVPSLVGLLIWVNRGIVFRHTPRTLSSVIVLGLSVLFSSSVIILIGLLAAHNLKSLIAGA